MRPPSHRCQHYKEWGLHASVDGSILVSSISGGNQMLAGGRIDTLCQRTHLTSPDAHTPEMFSAGSMLARVFPVRGQLLGLSLARGGEPSE